MAFWRRILSRFARDHDKQGSVPQAVLDAREAIVQPVHDRSHPEAVRLVIWDLDGTLWDGTLTEGGMSYRRDAHDIVIALAHRGIASAICSKNDFIQVREILQAEGLWQYFVFPSIDWTPKGPRIQSLIEQAQLRPATVLLIDDNPMNLAEAKFHVPGLQVSTDEIIPQLLEDPRLQGKDDRSLTRLNQYRLLQKRREDVRATSGDTEAFLRASQITVAIEHDVERHLDRAIELINRTNQLNFTKNRLPENPEDARVALRALIAPHTVQAGLLRVRDRYGDHGYCGFYALHSQHTKPRRLIHFCFSCRILNMGVENWLYKALGSPRLNVVGDVTTDIINDKTEVDWISRVMTGDEQDSAPSRPLADYVFVRGGCDIHTLAHYFSAVTSRVIGEFHVARNGQLPAISHSIMLRHALGGISREARAASRPFGFADEDFVSFAACAPLDERGLWILSFAQDNWTALYRYRPTGELIPIHMEGHNSLTSLLDGKAEIDPALLSHLRQWFDYAGPVENGTFLETVGMILDRAPPLARVVVLLGDERIARADGTPAPAAGMIRRNELIRQVASRYSNVMLMNIADFSAEGDRGPALGHHFHRQVYFRLFNGILKEIGRDPLYH